MLDGSVRYPFAVQLHARFAFCRARSLHVSVPPFVRRSALVILFPGLLAVQGEGVLGGERVHRARDIDGLVRCYCSSLRWWLTRKDGEEDEVS